MKKIVQISLLLIVLTSTVNAQVVAKYHTVLDVKTNARQYDNSDEVIELRGAFTKQIGQEMFSFRDDTEVIRVEVSDSWRPIIVIDKQVSILATVDDDENLVTEVELEALNYSDDIELSNIAYIKNNASILDRQDRVLKIRGRFIKEYNREHYLFSDGEQEIRVELENYLAPTINQECTILLTVDYNDNFIDIEVRNILPKENHN
ncbi:MAG: NirD/YgiW/YdeI family stress tolerance protein [Bacteroidales bacterium]